MCQFSAGVSQIRAPVSMRITNALVGGVGHSEESSSVRRPDADQGLHPKRRPPMDC